METNKKFMVLKAFFTMVFIGLFSVATNSECSQNIVPEQQTAMSVQARELADQLSGLFESAANVVQESVVPIFSEQEVEISSPFGFPNDAFRDFFGDDFFKRFFGGMPQGDQKQVIQGLGSGVIVSSDGYILTNNHVIDKADKLTVFITDKKKYSAKVVGTDPQTDVALIKVDARDLPAAHLGNSDEVRVGQWVIAVGNPFQLMHTVTAGIISAKGRSAVGLADYEDFIQTDASINPGNSGGALCDLDGNVIGINTAISSPSGGNVGIGFAIPINMAKHVMEELRENGEVTRGYLAVIPQDIDESLAKALKLKTTDGALISDVTENGPAAKAGIKRGDVILKFDGKKVANSTELRNMVAQTHPGAKAQILILRDGQEKMLTVVLGERPKNREDTLTGENTPDEQTGKRLGVSIQNLTPSLAQQLGYVNEQGIVVTSVEPGSPAAEAGMQPGDLIKSVNKTEVKSVENFNREVKGLRSGDSVALLMRRGDATFYVAIQIP